MSAMSVLTTNRMMRLPPGEPSIAITRPVSSNTMVGAMELRGEPHASAIVDAAAGRLLNEVLDGGINLIDTSIDYGRSEELIGRYLGHRRDELMMALRGTDALGWEGADLAGDDLALTRGWLSAKANGFGPRSRPSRARRSKTLNAN